MNVFLTGATGYLGQVLLHRLLADGHGVVALGRPAPGRRFLEHARLRWLLADLREADAVAQAARAADATIHTAAEHHGAMQAVDRLATEAFIAGMAGSGKALLSTSATVVYGDTGLTPRSEEGPILQSHPLRAWRAETDQRIAEAATQGIRGAVVRPPTIYGAAGGVIAARIAVARQAGFAPYVGEGAAIGSTIHAFDLADLFVAMLHDARAAGIYNAASDEMIARRTLAEGIAACVGGGIQARSVSLEEARKSMGELADLSLMNQVISSARARRELGWTPRRPPLMQLLREQRYAGEGLLPVEEVA